MKTIELIWGSILLVSVVAVFYYGTPSFWTWMNVFWGIYFVFHSLRSSQE